MNNFHLQKKYQNIFLVFNFFCITIGYIYFYPLFKLYFFTYILMSLFFFNFIFKLFTFKIDFKLDLGILLFFGTLLIFSSVSSLYQSNMAPLINYSVVVVFFYIIFYYFQIIKIDQNRMFEIIKIILIVNIFFILLNILLNDPSNLAQEKENILVRQYFYRMRGLFTNPNLFSRYLAFNLIICIVTYSWVINKNNHSFTHIKFLCLLNLFFIIPLIFATNSRNTLFALTISIIAFYVLKKFKFTINIKGFVIILTIFFISSVGILNTILKFNPESRMADVQTKIKISELLNESNYNVVKNNRGATSYRLSFWKESVKNFNFFGYVDYNKETSICEATRFIKKNCDVHNNYIHHTNKFGLIPAIMFHLFFFIIAVKSVTLFYKFKNYAYLFSSIFGIFTLMYWLFETATLVGSFFLTISFFSIGISQQQNLILHKKNLNYNSTKN